MAILQSNYIPWKGYFDIIAAVDEFILLDNVQYTPRDWRNRNLVKTNAGLRWLTVPVRHGRQSRISEVTIATDQGDWTRKHIGTIQHAYAAAPQDGEVLPWLESLYRAAASIAHLSTLNRGLLTEICAFLGVKTPITWSTDYLSCDALDALDKNDRLIEICRRAGATTYLSGPAAKAYLDLPPWDGAGIGVEWMDYSDYPEYPQLHGPFEHGVSIVDLLLMQGHEAGAWLKFAPRPA